MTPPLADLTVIETSSDIAVRYCGKLFAAHGAKVTRVASGAAGDTPFDRWLDHGKSTITGDPPGGLAVDADLVIAGLGKERIAEVVSRIAAVDRDRPLLAAISWFGDRGPYADWHGSDPIIQAMAGTAYAFGPAEGPPVLAQGHAPQIIAGATTYIAALAALIGRHEGRNVGRIDVNVLEAYLCFSETSAAGFTMGGPRSVRRGVNRFTPTYPASSYPTQDGWIGVTALTPQQWRSLCELVGLPELGRDPRFATAQSRLDHADLVDSALAPALLRRSAAEWLRLGQAVRIPLAPVPTPAELLATPHWRERGAFAKIGDGADTFEGPAMPFRLVPTGGDPRPARPGRGDQPLAGIRVLDLSMGWAGPLATRHLADLGAEVIKVESCSHMDWWRGWEVMLGGDPPPHEVRPSFVVTNRNKQGITIDLRDKRGVGLIRSLAARSDIVVENFAPGVLDRLGLSAEALTAENRSLIYMSMGAFGSRGPWRDFRAYGSTTEQASGLPFINGQSDWAPCLQHVAYGDAVGGIYGAVAGLTALYAQRRQGGAVIDLSQVECLFQLGADSIVAAAATGSPPDRGGSRRRGFPLCGCFPASGEDSWIAVAAETAKQAADLSRLIGTSSAADRTNGPSATGLESAMAVWCSKQEPSKAAAILQALGIPAAVVAPAHTLHADPHLAATGFWPAIERRFVGRHIVPAPPYLIDGTRPAVLAPAPTLGEHNAGVLAAALGLSPADLAGLATSGIIGTEPVAV